MKVGSKSILFGVHAFWFHPITVALGWRHLYGRWPRGWEWLAILVHDAAYWGKPNIDGPEGKTHPAGGAILAFKLCRRFSRGSMDERYYRARDLFELCYYHSRDQAKKDHAEPSKLCWADKLSMCYDPEWFYLLRARLSGEIKEYRRNAKDAIHPDAPDGLWFRWLRDRMKQQAEKANARLSR